jgi:hypothetical protein
VDFNWFICSYQLFSHEQKREINSDLPIKPSEIPAFSRHYACLTLKPYLSALVFALTSRNKGKFIFPADYLIQQPCGSTLRLPCSVSVNVHRGTYIGVSEKLLHILWGCPVREQIAGKGVSEHMNDIVNFLSNCLLMGIFFPVPFILYGYF